MIILFFISVMGIFITAVYGSNFISFFLGLGGAAFGGFLGCFVRSKKGQILPKNIFFRVLLLCLATVSFSVIGFMLFKEKNLIPIVILNVVGLITAIGMLVTGTKKSEHPMGS